MCSTTLSPSRTEQPSLGVMYFYFSSALNTIRVALLGEKLKLMQSPPFAYKIFDYLLVCVSRKVISKKETSGSCPLSNPLQPLQWDFSHCTGTCHILQFSDNSGIAGCISEVMRECREPLRSCGDGSKQRHAALCSKTKELVGHMSRNRVPLFFVSTQWASKTHGEGA